jgi:hypothetical protein
MQNIDIHFKLQQFPQNRVWTFQTQSVPIGTGPSDESGTAAGVVSLMLEFLQESDK